MTTNKTYQSLLSGLWSIAPKTKSLLQILTVSFATMLGFALMLFLCNVVVPFLFALVATVVMTFVTFIITNISGIVLAIVLIASLRKMILR